MAAIVNGKLYNTEKAENILVLFLEESKYGVYVTENGNIFAVDTFNDVIIDSEQLRKKLERNPECVDAYIEIFGMPEEA